MITAEDALVGVREALGETPHGRIMRVVDEGFSSIALDVGGILIRVARTQAAADGHAIERAVLPHLGPLLPVAIPQPTLYLEPSDALPYGALGYRRVEGRPLEWRLAPRDAPGLAHSLGAAMAALHGIDAGLARSWGMPIAWPADSFITIGNESLAIADERLPPDAVRHLLEWWRALQVESHDMLLSRAPRHGDLWYGNVLRMVTDPARVGGIVDWETVGVGDPAEDFATLLYHGATFMETALTAYDGAGGEVDPGLLHRIGQWWQVREFFGLALARIMGDESEVRSASAKVLGGGIFRPWQATRGRRRNRA